MAMGKHPDYHGSYYQHLTADVSRSVAVRWQTLVDAASPRDRVSVGGWKALSEILRGCTIRMPRTDANQPVYVRRSERLR